MWRTQIGVVACDEVAGDKKSCRPLMGEWEVSKR
jgi:hypothetical protein